MINPDIAEMSLIITVVSSSRAMRLMPGEANAMTRTPRVIPSRAICERGRVAMAVIFSRRGLIALRRMLRLHTTRCCGVSVYPAA